MAIDTTATPTTAPVEHEYDVDDQGAVRDWREVVKGRDEAEDDEESQGVITGAIECAFKNGTGQLDDPVMVDGRRGAVAQFLFRSASQGKKKNQPGGWDAVIRFDEGEPKERRLDPSQVSLLLDEITRAPRPPISEQTTAYGVPTDASFGDDEDVKPAPGLLDLATALMQETADFEPLKLLPRQVAFFWARKGGKSGGQPTIYRARFATKHERRVNKWRLVITFSADVCRTLLLKEEVVEAIVHESLCQFDRDERGNLSKVAPDFRGYTANVARFGTLLPPVRRAAETLQIQAENIRNLRLDLDDDEADEAEGDRRGGNT